MNTESSKSPIHQLLCKIHTPGGGHIAAHTNITGVAHANFTGINKIQVDC
jgi:hypothetical protein